MKRVCVFCGSRAGARPGFAHAADRLAESLARRGLELVYGGSKLGLMGILADAILSRGGRVVGVIPELLMKTEVVHEGLSDLEHGLNEGFLRPEQRDLVMVDEHPEALLSRIEAYVAPTEARLLSLEQA